MKRNIRIITLILTFFAISSGLSVKAQRLNQKGKQPSTENTFLDPLSIVSSDTTVIAKQKELKDLQGELSNAEKNLKDLNTKISKQQDKLKNYCLDLIDIGVNFLFIPYNDGVNTIAIPALKKATEKYNNFDKEFGVYLKFLQSYNKDCQAIKTFISQNPINKDTNLDAWFVDFNTTFYSLPTVANYVKNFGDGWKDTYLGKQIQQIIDAANTIPAKGLGSTVAKTLNTVYNNL